MAPLAVAAITATAGPQQLEAWRSFTASFQRTYDGEEHDRRFQIFLANLKHVEEENAKDHTYKLAVNQFADMTLEEFHGHRFGFRSPIRVGEVHLGVHAYTGEALADSVDWVSNGAVTPVKDQSSCGSCWAFSTTGSLEGAWQIATGQLVALSEEQLVDCSKANDGCDGGAMASAFEFIETAGACTEESYPYLAGSSEAAGVCKSSCDIAVPAGGVTGYVDVEQDEQAHMSALMKGPVSVAIQADQSAFQMYSSGVMTGVCGNNLDHGVLAVGYGVDGGQKYWKVKNSWGAAWGEQGYIRIERGAGDAGKCGILSMSSYPVVDGDVPPAPPTPPTPPSPEPTPAPSPSPSPSGYDCIFAETEGECLSTAQNGLTCTWCDFGGIIDDLGLCMDPGYDCGGSDPTPSPAPSGKHHYGAPPCLPDEIIGSMEGGGRLCAPRCDANGGCTMDVDQSCSNPQPQCILQDASGDEYCGLMCGDSYGDCPSGAQCSSNVCVYPGVAARRFTTKQVDVVV